MHSFLRKEEEKEEVVVVVGEGVGGVVDLEEVRFGDFK
jgi:hypothetical protein